MVRKLRRRDVLRMGGAALAAGVAGCNTNPKADWNTGTPTPTPTATPKQMKPFDAAHGKTFETVTKIERKIHELVNQARTTHGRDALNYDPRLAYVGRVHARDMAKRDYFSHENPEGQGPDDRAREYGVDEYTGILENIARMSFSKSTADAVAQGLFTMWKNSEPHWRAILERGLDRHGTGVYIPKTGLLFAAMELGDL